MTNHTPEILAPAGDKNCFLAALAAGADAIYVGLKHFSARMQAKNFSISELGALTKLAHSKDTKVYIAMNTLVKPSDLESAGRLIERVAKYVKPDALIVQDLSIMSLARQVGYKGEMHLSTLANCTHPSALQQAADMGFDRIVVPRELNLDEVSQMAEACPENVSLELFIHGALCYCVSGRCYWSSWFGGKSGLRGRCVQPCRRNYTQGKNKDVPVRMFSCKDLSLDVLTKPVAKMEKISSWKIEGRKKGPHYVFYTVMAYKTLRDNNFSAKSRKMAESFLEQALGRPSTHSTFLPQRPFMPVELHGETASGKTIGAIRKLNPKGPKGPQGKMPHKKQSGHKKPQYYFHTNTELLPGDLIRVGYEDDRFHCVIPIRRRVPKGGRVPVNVRSGPPPRIDTKAFLLDRREPELMGLIKELNNELGEIPEKSQARPSFTPRRHQPMREGRSRGMQVSRTFPRGRSHGDIAIWLSGKALQHTPKGISSKVTWWLPPVIWPDREEAVQKLVNMALQSGSTRFVLNAPWQMGLFPDDTKLYLTAGPFCNIANAETIATYKRMGFSAAIVSPELNEDEFMALPSQSELPLGVVISGMWPLGISRFLAPGSKIEEPIASPRGELSFIRQYDGDNWIFPGWELDITPEQRKLEKAGYKIFIDIKEHMPKTMPKAKRTSSFNWKLNLL
ncbi:MAG: U32 family peptidase [Desulfovibrio sp.]